MKKPIIAISALALLAGVGSGGLMPTGAFAQATPPAANAPAQAPMVKPDRPHWSAVARDLEAAAQGGDPAEGLDGAQICAPGRRCGLPHQIA